MAWVGCVCLVLRAPVGTLGGPMLSLPGEIQAMATQPLGHKNKLPSRPTATVAWGQVGLKVQMGGPTLLDDLEAQVVLPIGWGQHPMACMSRQGSWTGPRARWALLCPGDLPGITRLQCQQTGGGGGRGHTA